MISLTRICCYNNINEKTPDGWNPLHLLCDNYQGDNLENLILLLKDSNIDLKATTNEGFTASYLCQTAFDKRKLKMSQRLSGILSELETSSPNSSFISTETVKYSIYGLMGLGAVMIVIYIASQVTKGKSR